MFPRLAAYFLFFKLVSVAVAAPVETTPGNAVTETSDCHNESADVYDQRQNGTENYRIHVNGVVVLVAPAETVLQAAQLGGLPLGPETETGAVSTTSQPLKPKPKPPTVTDKVPTEGHHVGETATHPKDPKDKNNLKLLNLLHMFRSIRHESEGTVHHSTQN